jgi:hypothetical protein
LHGWDDRKSDGAVEMRVNDGRHIALRVLREAQYWDSMIRSFKDAATEELFSAASIVTLPISQKQPYAEWTIFSLLPT